MNILSLLLFIAAAVVFLVKAFLRPTTTIDLIALGLALLTAALFCQFGIVDETPIYLIE